LVSRIRFDQSIFELTIAVVASTFLKTTEPVNRLLENLWIDQGFNRRQECRRGNGRMSERGSEAQAWRSNKHFSKCKQTKTHLSATEKN
jgi:hypothetical protein